VKCGVAYTRRFCAVLDAVNTVFGLGRGNAIGGLMRELQQMGKKRSEASADGLP